MLRRAFLSTMSGVGGVFGFVPQAAAATPRFEASRYAQDAWLDELPGRHRVCFDTFSAERFAEAVGFAGTYLRASKDAYGLSERDLAIVIVVRHGSGPFAFNDAMWAKYGKAFSDRMHFTDPKTHQPPVSNAYAAELTALSKQGVQLAVCEMTTRAYTRILAEQGHGDAEAVYKELTGNTIAPSRFVPAGTVAVTRAQEHGYALVPIG